MWLESIRTFPSCKLFLLIAGNTFAAISTGTFTRTVSP